MGQSKFLLLEWEIILEDGRVASWPTAWIYGKEMGILPHYYFPWKDLWIVLPEEEEDMWKENMIIFLEKTWNVTSRKKSTSENYSDGTLQEHSLAQVRTE